MATIQGMCRNCGALIMFDDRDEQCECVFCNCIFPSAEAVEIFENPEGRTFPNEKFEPSAENKHHYTTRVFSDEGLEKAIKRDEITKANKGEDKKTNEFELSPNDVKAPKKLVWGTIIAAVAIVALVIVIALPMYKSRKALEENIRNNISGVFSGISVDNTMGEDGNPIGYSIDGQKCQKIKVLTSDEVNEDLAKEIYGRYCDLRAEYIGEDDSKVVMDIYCDGGIYTIKTDAGNTAVVFTEDEA